ncbi:MAG: alpha/beta hydrolase [Bacteroidota bacterium]
MKHTFLPIIFLLLTFFLSCKPDAPFVERFFFEHDGARLAVQVDGNLSSNVMILFLHGGPGGNGYEYNQGKYTQLLEEQYAMVYLDQRGQGSSQGRYSGDDITLQQFSDDIDGLVDLLKLRYGTEKKIFLAGHSWGGTTGTHCLLHTPIQSKLAGWIEMSGAHDIPLINRSAIEMFLTIGQAEIDQGNNVEDWQEIVDFANRVDTLNITEDQGGVINGFGFRAEGLVVRLEGRPVAEVASDRFLISPIAPLTGLVAGQMTSGQILEETEQTSLTDRLSEVTIPTLLLWGKYDFVVPPRLGQTALNEIGTADKSLVIFEESGHSPMSNEPEAFVQAIIDFVEAYR